MKTKLSFIALALLLLPLPLAACSADSHEGSDAAADGRETCPPKPKFACLDAKSPPSYANDIVPIIHDRCAPCHFPGGVSVKKDDFSTYDGVDNAGTSILNQLSECKMPPILGDAEYGIEAGTVPELSAEQLATFVEWLECRAPNN